MKKNIARIVSVFAVVAFFSAGPSLAADFSGLWETSVAMEMEGMSFGMPSLTAVKSQQCISKDSPVPMNAKEGDDCKKNVKKSGSRISWTFECTSKSGDVTKGNGEINLSGNTYKGKMKMTISPKHGKKMTQSAKLEGKRLGDCKK